MHNIMANGMNGASQTMLICMVAVTSLAAFGDRQGVKTHIPMQQCIKYFHNDRKAHHKKDISDYAAQPMTAYKMITGRRSNARELERIGRECGTRFIVLHGSLIGQRFNQDFLPWDDDLDVSVLPEDVNNLQKWTRRKPKGCTSCLLYTSPSPRDGLLSRMPSSA